jgi:predicted TIM-barrel fold metal-dependent hydrolase
MGLPFKLVSADSHIVEPPDLWLKHIDKKFRDRAPRIITNDQGLDVFVCEGSPRSGAGFGLVATKQKYIDPEHSFGMNEGGWKDVPEPGYDPYERIKELDREGIEAELIYTSLGLTMYGIPDKEFQFACMRAFNDWLAEFCATSPKRLFGIAMIPTDDVDVGVAELERCAKLGHRGAMISITQDQDGMGYENPIFDKLWSAAEDHRMPISLHVAASKKGFTATGNIMADFSVGFWPTMFTVAGMIFSGLFDRHRKLKVLSVENDAAWPLAILERMDDRFDFDDTWAKSANHITSGRKPSEIFHEHVGATFMRDRTAIVNREIIGRDNIMWGSDYPHFDGAWPGSADDLGSQFDGISLEDQIRIGRTNAIKFYDLPVEVEAPVAA